MPRGLASVGRESGHVRTTEAVFLHGSGRHGQDAWPAQLALEPERPCHFLERVAPGDPPDQMIEEALARTTGPVHVVAHSQGCLSALLLAEGRADRCRSLTLIEPALFSLVPDAPLTAAHIALADPVFARADDPTLGDVDFSLLFGESLGLGRPDEPAEVLAEMGRRIRAVTPSWKVPVDGDVVARIPTLAVAGIEESMFVEVAAELGRRGARVARIAGPRHRPHDAPEFGALLVEHWGRAEARLAG